MNKNEITIIIVVALGIIFFAYTAMVGVASVNYFSVPDECREHCISQGATVFRLKNFECNKLNTPYTCSPRHGFKWIEMKEGDTCCCICEQI